MNYGTAFGAPAARIGRSEAARRIDALGRKVQAALRAVEDAARPPPPPRPAPRVPRPSGEPGEAPARMPDTARAILRAVGTVHGVDLQEMLSDSRQQRVSRARAEAMYRCAAETSLSIAQIGRIFRKDHTTVGFAVSKHALVTGKPAARGMNWACATRKRRRAG